MLYINPTTNFSGLYPDTNWSFKDVKRSQTNYITHGYHRYPAKFIPQIVRKLINRYTDPGDIVFDPFGGCGTTLVEAKILGRKSIGYDINPVAKLITKAKINPINPDRLNRSWDRFLSEYNNSKTANFSYPEHSERIKYWFDDEILEDLDLIFTTITKIPNCKIRTFYLCAFSNILKNSSRWLMKSTKPQIDPAKIPNPSFETFRQQILGMFKKNKSFYELLVENGNLDTPAKMYLRDSTKKFNLADNSVNIVITSPPYVTSYEYADLHQLTTYWLADYKTIFPRWVNYAGNFQAHREKYIGSKHGKGNRKRELMSNSAELIIEQLNSNKSRYRNSVEKYFSDMAKSIKHIHRVLSTSGKLCMIIGNTNLSGVEIKNAEVATEQILKSGFSIQNVIKRELSNKTITPFRDRVTGKFTSGKNPNSKRVYKYEYLLIASR